MHIPDAYLSPATQAAAFGLMLPIWVVAAKRTASTLTTRQTPLLSVGAAFAFTVQMFNVPAAAGTTAHALGAALLAILVGPWAAVLGMSLTLAVQALCFGDGGILSYGANCLTMAVVAPFASYGVYQLLRDAKNSLSNRSLFAAAVGAYAGIVLASLAVAVILGVQPSLAHNASGQALYCPFGLSVTVPALMMTHLLAAGPAEAIITLAALAYLRASFPNLLRSESRPKADAGWRLARRAALLLLATPLGLLAAGTAFGEWDTQEIVQRVGYAPEGMVARSAILHPLLPDYSFVGVDGRAWEVAGYLTSGLIGFLVVAVFARALLCRNAGSSTVVDRPSQANMGSEMPSWLREPNRIQPGAYRRARRRDLFASVAKSAREAIEESLISSRTAHEQGLLQSIRPDLKALGFVTTLILLSASSHPVWPVAAAVATSVLAWLSRMSMGRLFRRTSSATIFFGAPLALLLATQHTSLFSGAMLISRLFGSILLSLVWITTSDVRDLSRSLKMPVKVRNAILLTFRYLFVLLDTLCEMVTARRARQVGIGRNRDVQAYAGAGAAILFAKSLALTEEIHQAMRARGAELTGSAVEPVAARLMGATDAI